MALAQVKSFRTRLTHLFLFAGLGMQMSAQAVTVQEIYSFPSIPTPNSVLVQDADGVFYGTTSGGGDFGAGTIYRTTTNGTLQTLVSFANTNGTSPNGGLVLGGDGALYGTTEQGGNANFGTVFRVTTNGDLTTLVSFDYVTNGAVPRFGLIQGTDGAFYGTTTYGGPGFTNDGTIFRLTTNGVLTTLAAFADFDGTNQFPNGTSPSVLVMANDGAFYGATLTGGSNNSGTIFRVTTNGALSTLASFSDTNGAKAQVDLVAGSSGVFYGTTLTHIPESSTVFRISTNGELTTLATFTNGLAFNLGLAQANDGDIYGTTGFIPPETNYFPGEYAYAEGTIFRLVPPDGLTTLFSFENSVEVQPQAGLTFGQDGALYGTTTGGGDNNYGVVFRVTTNGDLNALASFANTNGADPRGGLVQGGDKMFYGTTFQGGSNNRGTIFRVTADGPLKTLVTFDGENGANPDGDLIVGGDGALYGTTVLGGTYSAGTVFRVTTNGILTTLASFDGTNGYSPSAALAPGNDGFFYGTTASGPGSNGFGTIFRVATNGDLRRLASFSRTNGADPRSALLLGVDGAFYGTTYAGGAHDEGTVFRVTTDGDLTTLVSFDNTNGANPQTSLTLGEDSAFYGTTSLGGAADWGTVFRITTNGDLTTSVSFSPDLLLGFPYANLISDDRGAFYGNAGELFRVSTNGSLTLLAPNFYGSAYGNLIHAGDGWYYGTTFLSSGTRGGGSIFRMNPAVQMQPLTHTNAVWRISFSAIPGDSYRVLRATNLPGPWDLLVNITTDSNGLGQFDDSDPPPGSAFYRIGTP